MERERGNCGIDEGGRRRGRGGEGTFLLVDIFLEKFHVTC
jgi:hypothetical protein